MKKFLFFTKCFTIAFILFITPIIRAQTSVLSWDFESNNIGDSLAHISWAPYDIQSAVVDDPLSSGNKVMENVIHNYNAAPVLMLVLPAGKTLADYDSLTFKGYFQKGDVAYKGIVVQAYQTKPTGHFLDTDTLGLYNRAQVASTAWEDIGIDISNTSTLSDTIYLAFGISCSGEANGDTTTWFADDVSLIAKVNNPPPPPPPTQILTNGGFESSDPGVVDSTNVKGWLIQVVSGITPPPVFEIVSDTVEQGNRALKVTVHGLGTNQWDIQAVADSIHITPGVTYNYSIWAKSDNAGAQVNFTIGNYSYSEYGAIRPATLTTSWKKYSMQFKVSDNQSIIRAPIHFSYAANADNAIYIDNLQIVDANAGKKPVIVEAESGKVGSYFSTKQDNNITYVTTDSNYTGLNSPGDTSREITYQVTFVDSGYYNLFSHLRVGAGTFNDDSFFYGRGFGEKDDTASVDWVFVNGLASGGFSDSAAVVDGAGSVGASVWKWVNISKNTYSGVPGDSFYVSLDSLTRTFQIGSREDGLDIDKFAFGKSNLYYTVDALNKVLPGSTTYPKTDTGTVYAGPPLAQGQPKFLGSAGDSPDNNFANYWTQITPENAGKWGSVGTSTDTTKWNWSGLDNDYNYAKDHNLIFKDHNLIWGAQQPSWISGLDSAQQISYIETWIRMVGQKYPDLDMIDVVNEPLNGHNPPDGGNGRANYKNALGGNGVTGWDWVIKAFELARQYIPNAKLLINDYGIINNNSATTSYLQVINLLKDRGLIDGIGCQAHGLENTSAATIKSNLDRLAATGLPIYISELDLNIQNDNLQKTKYQELFPVMWQHPGVAGITLWGYIQGRTWVTYSYLVNSSGYARPALLWLAQYIKDNPVGVEEAASDLPSRYELTQNFPNPFNPSTNIRYSLVKTARVTLKVYDILGREVKTLVNTVQAPGKYTVTFNAQNLASGVYFYRINTENFTATKKLLLLK